MVGVFDIEKDTAGEYRFQLKAGDVIVLCSCGYKSKLGCTNGIESVRNHSSNPDNFVKEQTPPGKHRFKLISSNGRVLGVSQLYETASGYKNGMAFVQRLARGASVNDRTLRANTIRSGRTVKVDKAPLRYRIYAAPRDRRGIYHPHSNKTLSVEGFKTEQARDAYWNKRIVPVTDDTAGADYEYRKCDFPDTGLWKWVGEPRYSNEKLIKGNIEKFRGKA